MREFPFFLTATVGLGIDVLLFQRMNYHKVAFSIPVIPVVVMIVTLFALCAFSYRWQQADSWKEMALW